jgi:hypothetical protein
MGMNKRRLEYARKTTASSRRAKKLGKRFKVKS